MAKTTPAAYVAAKVARLEAVEISTGVKLFANVGRCADLTIERITKLGVGPSALIQNLGGELDDANNEIWVKRLAVTIILQSHFDPYMDEAAERMDIYTEKVIDELQADRRDDGIFCIFQDADEDVSMDGSNWLMRTLVFQYTIDRTV